MYCAHQLEQHSISLLEQSPATRQARRTPGVVERHADHGRITDGGYALVETSPPYLERPMLVAGDAHNPVVFGRDHLEKQGRPLMISFSKDAPDFASVECTGTRSVAPWSSASSDCAVQGRFVPSQPGLSFSSDFGSRSGRRSRVLASACSRRHAAILS
jgi:hypothetical protein